MITFPCQLRLHDAQQNQLLNTFPTFVALCFLLSGSHSAQFRTPRAHVPHLVHLGRLVLVDAVQVLCVGQAAAAAAAAIAAAQGRRTVRRAGLPLADEPVLPAEGQHQNRSE